MRDQQNSIPKDGQKEICPQADELCQVIFENANEGIFIADEKGRIIKANPHLCGVLGYTAEQIQALAIEDIVLQRNANKPLHHINKPDHSVDQQKQCVLQHKDGFMLDAKLRFRSLDGGYTVCLVHEFTYRNEIESWLSDSDQLFRLLAESSITGIYLVFDGQFDYVNKAFADMFGYELSEFSDNFQIADIVFPDDRSLVFENLRRRVEGEEESVRYSFRGLRKDGSIIYVDVHSRRIQYKSEVGVIGTLIDITDAKKTEISLRSSEERFRKLFNENPSMFFTLNGDGIITAVNDFGANQLGYNADDLQGLGFLELIKDEYKSTASDLFNACLKSHGLVHQWRLEKKRKDGSMMWVEEHMRSVTGVDGKINVFVVCQDISQHVKLEESLKVSQFIFDQASTGIFLIKNDNQIVDVNLHACRSLGYTKEELCNLSVPDIDSSISIEQLANLAAQLEKTKSTTFKTLHQRKNGETFPVQIFISTLPYKDEIFRVSFVQDISEIEEVRKEQEKLEAQLKQVQKLEAVGRLAGGVAHDLNNLLTPMLGYSDLLIMDNSLDSGVKAKAAQINKAAKGARDLVKQLLAFSRKQVLQYQPINLSKIVTEFDELIRRTIRENIEISIITSTDLKPIMADRGQIEQVMMNLVVNASEAMPNGGKLSIETKMTDLDEIYASTHPDVTPGTYVMLRISDTGEGMDEDVLSKIYEPFFSTKGELGTGLGLATVYGIVKQHRGNIWVYSEPGMGTNFKIFLPIAEQVPKKSSYKSEKKSNKRGTETILLVEDNEAVRTTVYDCLKEHGYHVITAVDGNMAIKSISEGITFDMLLTDVVMPDMNGKELFSYIAAQNPLAKVLYMSGYTDNIIVHHGVLDEDVQFIQKPFSSREILQKVRTILDS